MSTTSSLSERVEQMRKCGVVRWREGDFEIELGPAPITATVADVLGEQPRFRANIEGRDPFMNLTEEEQTDLFNAVISPVKGA